MTAIVVLPVLLPSRKETRSHTETQLSGSVLSPGTVTPGIGPAQGALFRRGDFRQCGKGNTDARTQAICTLDGDTPVISLDDCLADRKSEPETRGGAGTRGVATAKTFKEVGQMFCRYSCS